MNRRDFMRMAAAAVAAQALPLPAAAPAVDLGSADCSVMTLWSSVDGIIWSREYDRPVTEILHELLFLYGQGNVKIVTEHGEGVVHAKS